MTKGPSLQSLILPTKKMLSLPPMSSVSPQAPQGESRRAHEALAPKNRFRFAVLVVLVCWFLFTSRFWWHIRVVLGWFLALGRWYESCAKRIALYCNFLPWITVWTPEHYGKTQSHPSKLPVAVFQCNAFWHLLPDETSCSHPRKAQGPQLPNLK